jgi:actin-related protein
MTVGEMSKAAAAASAAAGGKQYMKNGEISDWEGLEKVWKSLYQLEAASDAALDPSEHPVLLSWSPSFSSKDAEKAAEILFENDSFRIPAISFGLSPVLALYASGRTTGCSVHSGESYTHTVAVLEGFALSGSLMRTSVAGKAVTENFANLIASRLAALGSNGGPSSRFDPYAAHSGDFLRLEKSKYCQCAPTRQALRPSSSSSSSSSAGDEERLLYTGLGSGDENVQQSTPLLLPDGTVISLNVQSDEQSSCAEVLFRSTVKSAFTQEPSLSIQASIEKCIASVDTDSQASLWANVVVSGGNTNIRGFSERLRNELGAMGRDGWLESNTPVHVFDTDEVLADRADAPWLGGSVLASSDSFRGWVTRQEYKEHGPALIHTRCQTAM